MKLSTKITYGLQAMIDIRDIEAGNVVSINQLAARQNISSLYLEQIIASLKQYNIVTSVRGAAGGYCLSKRSSDISLYDIITALDANISIADDNTMEDIDPIRNVLHETLYKKADENIHRFLKTLTLDQLRTDMFDDLMYYI